ncbi:MAG: MarR family transcriptional regulator [Firmicutes bacterium]|nr:MarR family transcriptional regulator [Bacillota bacterium]
MSLNDQIIELTNMILSNAIHHEHKQRNFGGGFTLHSSQLRFIDTIHRNPGINVTDLAQMLGISKSAVSKMTSKLETLGLVQRYQAPENKKDVLVKLTDQGELVHRRFLKTYHNVFNHIHNQLDEYTPEEKATIIRFLRGFNNFILNMDSLQIWPED